MNVYLELCLVQGSDFIRPDGHVGLASEKQLVRVLKLYLETFEIVAFGME